MIFEPTPDQQAFASRARTFATSEVAPLAASIDATGVFPRELVRRASAAGLSAMTLARAWGGAGSDHVGYVLAIEEIAAASATVAVILAVNTSLVADPIARFGTEAQKRRWLPGLTGGSSLGAFALSEQDAGTDAANQQTRALKDGDTFRLRGRKVWVANAEAADVAIVFATTEPKARGKAVSAFLVPLSSPGIRRTAKDDSLGVRGLGCVDLDFDDVAVDAGQVLGPVNEGFAVAKWALEGGRIAIAAQAIGIGRAALEEALSHARRRQTFGKPLGRHQAIQFMLADIATELDAAELLTLDAAQARDGQHPAGVEAAMAKLYASEAAHRAADRALQILASAGYRKGSTVERLFRDGRATEIYQGTSEAQRMIIAAGILTQDS